VLQDIICTFTDKQIDISSPSLHLLQADYAHYVSLQESIPRHQYPLLDFTLKMVLCIHCVKEGTGTQNLYKTLTTSTLFSTFQT